MMIKYWRSRNIMDTKGENVECTVKQLFSFLHKSRLNVSSKNKIPVWAPVSFRGTRSAANVENIYCMVFDIDDGLVYWDIETKTLTDRGGVSSRRPPRHDLDARERPGRRSGRSC